MKIEKKIERYRRCQCVNENRKTKFGTQGTSGAYVG